MRGVNYRKKKIKDRFMQGVMLLGWMLMVEKSQTREICNNTALYEHMSAGKHKQHWGCFTGKYASPQMWSGMQQTLLAA